MRIRQGPDQHTLQLRSGNTANGCIGAAIGLFGALFGTVIATTIFVAHRAAPGMPTPWWILFTPLFFLVIGLFFLGTVTRYHATIRQHGPSEVSRRRWLGLSTEEDGFHPSEAHHLLLHTEEKIHRNKNGTSRYRISTLAVVLRDGREVIIGLQRRGGLGGKQPMLEQAGEISYFLGLHLERTGYGAPLGYDIPPGGVAGPPHTWGAQPQHPQYQGGGHYPPGAAPGPAHYSQPPHHPQQRPQQRPQNPGDGGGLPGWIRGDGNR